MTEPIQRNCKNCGAPLTHSYNHRCEYCGTLYDFNEPEENTIKINPCDLVDITLRNITISPITNSFILIFDGYKCVMPKIYEYNGNENIYVSKVEEYINPPKCGFCIEVPIRELEQYGFNYLVHAIQNTGVRPTEWEKIRMQIQENEQLNKIMRRIKY